jgi:hypothetical protein
VHEVPGAQVALLILDDQDALALQDEEVLLLGLAVVERVRLAGLENDKPDPELRERLVELRELGGVSEVPADAPPGVARVDDEPARRDGDEPAAGLVEVRFTRRAYSAEPRRVIT